MQYKPEQEKQLIEDLLAFSYDPLGFVMYNYPWGETGTPLAMYEGPRGWQMEVLHEIKEHVCKQQNFLDLGFLDELQVFQEAIASGRGIGKSALFAMLADWMLSCHLGTTVTVTANTESQLKTKTFPEFGRWFTMGLNAHWWEVDTLSVKPQKWLAELVHRQLRIDTKYWQATGVNWSEENPDSFAGTHNSYGLAVFYDEASGIPPTIWNVTDGFFTEINPFRLWIAFSQGRRNSGAFFDRFNDPMVKKYWRTKQIDARTVEGTDKRVLQQIIDMHGENSDEARVEVYGLFPEQGEGQLIATPVVRAARERVLGAAEDNDEPLIMGVDPAPRGRTVIRLRQGRDARSFPVTVLHNKDNVQIADAVVELMNTYDPDAIAVDAGNGTGVIDELRRRHIRVYEVWFGNTAMDSNGEFALIVGELWGAMRDWLPGGCIDDSMPLFNDLTKRTWKWHGGREDGKKSLNSKRDMAKEGIPSPDDGDALALTFYPKLPSRRRRARRFGGNNNGGVYIAKGTGECSL